MSDIDTEALKSAFDSETYITSRMKNTSNGSHRVDGVCPICDKSNNTKNNFSYYQDTKTWYCFGGCGGGDVIAFIQKMDGVTFPEACQIIGFDSQLPPMVAVKKSRNPPISPSQSEDSQPLEWQRTAEKTVNWCQSQLWGIHSGKLLYLNERGISDKVIERYKIGYNPKTVDTDPSLWGLPKTNVPMKMTGGYIIPWIYNSTIRAISIRTLDAPKSKGSYYGVRGSLRRIAFGLDEVLSIPIVLVETELDALLINSIASDICVAIAMGSSGGRGFYTLSTLALAPMVLLSFDNDGAGSDASAWWSESLPANSKVHKPILGKDVGDMEAACIDVRAWLISGIGVRAKARQPMPTPPNDLEIIRDEARQAQAQAQAQNFTQSGMFPFAATKPKKNGYN
jgi:DNA primase